MFTSRVLYMSALLDLNSYYLSRISVNASIHEPKIFLSTSTSTDMHNQKHSELLTNIIDKKPHSTSR